MRIQKQVIEDVGRLKTHSLSVLQRGTRLIEQLYFSNGVKIGKGHLYKAIGLANAVSELWTVDNADLQEELSEDEQAELITAYRLSAIAEELLRANASKVLPEKLKLLANNNLSPRYKHVSDSRCVLFELETFARMHRISDTTQLREGAGSDIRLTYRSVLMQVECKYVTSDNPKTVLDRIEEACEQIARLPKYFGLIAVEIDSFVSHQSIINVDAPMDAYQHLQSATQAFFESYNGQLQDLISDYEEVKGLLIMAHSITRVKNKSCIDVGICNVANAAKWAPKRSRDFSILLDMANDMRLGFN